MTLVALDIGTYSIKALALDPKRKYLPVAFVEERIVRAAEAAVAPQSEGDEATSESGAAPIEATVGLGEESSSSSSTAAPAKVSGGGEEAAAQGEELPGQRPWQQALMRVLERLEFDGDGAIVALPHGKSFSLQIQGLPFSDKGKVAQILPAMLSPKLPFGLDELVYDFFINEHEADGAAAGEVAGPEAFVGAARRKDMVEYLARLSEVGVNPSRVGLSELMLRYVAEGYVPESQHQTVALLDMGHERTLVHVIERGHTVLARSINHGGHDVTREIAETFKASEEQAREVKHARGAILEEREGRDASVQALSDAIERSFKPLVRDLRRTFQALYARERVEVRKVYVFGGNSRLGNLAPYLSEQLGVTVEPLKLEGLIEGEEELEPGAASRMHAPLTMALQVVRDRSGDRGVNLRSGALAYRGKSSYLRSQLKRFGAVAAILLALLGIALFMQARDLNAQRDAMRASVKQETEKIFGTPVYKASAIKKRVEGIEGGEGGGGGFAPKMSAYEVFFELSSRIRPDVELTLSRIEVDAERNLIQLYGTTSSPQSVDDIVSDLEQLECLKSIKKDKLQVKKDDEVNFELQIASACS